MQMLTSKRVWRGNVADKVAVVLLAASEVHGPGWSAVIDYFSFTGSYRPEEVHCRGHGLLAYLSTDTCKETTQMEMKLSLPEGTYVYLNSQLSCRLTLATGNYG